MQGGFWCQQVSVWPPLVVQDNGGLEYRSQLVVTNDVIYMMMLYNIIVYIRHCW